MPTTPNTIQLKKNGQIVYPITDVSCVMGLNGSAVTEAILCWDGASTPVVANIPAGVVVTYNTTNYTGTLAASSSTTGKIYMVATGTANNYDRYMTFASGSSYAWENIGDTTIDLTTYATQAELDQLEAEVDGLFVNSTADLDLGDENGNVVARFEGGHIKTLHFDSNDIVDKGILSLPNKVDALSVNEFKLDTEHTYNLFNPADFDGTDSGFIPISIENGTYIHMHFLEYVYYDRTTNSNQSVTINPFSTFCRFYDSNKDIISVDTTNSYQKTIPSNAAFVKVRLIDAKYKDVAWLPYDYTTATYSRGGIEHREYPKELGFTKTGYEDFTIVCFGDSITQGIERKPLNISYVSYLEDLLHCHTINVGFGGTRMAYVGATTLFSFANLADVIVSDAADKWDDLDDYVADEVPAYAKHLNNLKGIDWENVDAISVFYGMNDYAYQGSGTPIGADGTIDKTTYNGACAYALDKLLTKYPWLQVILISPYDRYVDASTNSSNTANSIGKYMKDYADSLIGVQDMFRCPILDFYRESNINKYSYKTMMNDGVHAYVYPTVKRLAKMLAGCITNKLY